MPVVTNDAVFAAIRRRLAAGNGARINSLGRFYWSLRPATTGRDPMTGSAVSLPERRRLFFAAHVAFADWLDDPRRPRPSASPPWIAPRNATQSFIQDVCDGIEAGEAVLPGLGVFRIQIRPPRTTRNPQTGEEILVDERRILRFEPDEGSSHP